MGFGLPSCSPLSASSAIVCSFRPAIVGLTSRKEIKILAATPFRPLSRHFFLTAFNTKRRMESKHVKG